MQQGTIKSLTEKGFGFITREGEAKDLFFHSSQLKNCRYAELKIGDTLEFEVEQGDKGLFAAGITVLNS